MLVSTRGSPGCMFATRSRESVCASSLHGGSMRTAQPSTRRGDRGGSLRPDRVRSMTTSPDDGAVALWPVPRPVDACGQSSCPDHRVPQQAAGSARKWTWSVPVTLFHVKRERASAAGGTSWERLCGACATAEVETKLRELEQKRERGCASCHDADREASGHPTCRVADSAGDAQRGAMHRGSMR